MISHLRHGKSPGWLGGQKPGYEIPGSLTDELRRTVVSSQDFLVQGSCVLILEGQIAAHQGKENNTTAPQVAKRWDIAVACDHLRRCVARGAACRFQQLTIPEDVAEPEVDNLYILVLIEQEVLRLQIPVHDVHGMDLLQARYDLMEEAACLWLGHTSLRYDVVEQLAAARILHDKVKLAPCLDDLIKLHYVWVPDKFENVYLSGHTLYICHLYDALFLENFNGDALTGKNVSSKLDLSKRTLANSLA